MGSVAPGRVNRQNAQPAGGVDPGLRDCRVSLAPRFPSSSKPRARRTFGILNTQGAGSLLPLSIGGRPLKDAPVRSKL